jgi:hypothetical protein
MYLRGKDSVKSLDLFNMAKCGEHDIIQNYMNGIESQILR